MAGSPSAMAGTRGGAARVAAMVAALAIGLVLALAGRAGAVGPIGLSVAGGDGWHRSSEFEVDWASPSGTPPSAAAWRLVGPGFDSGQRVVAETGIDRISGIVPPAAGEYSLWVELIDAFGKEMGVAQSVPLRLDDVPPALSFIAAGAEAVPPLLVAVVADPLSGPAAGTISYRRAGSETWSPLATELRRGAFGFELVAPTPKLATGVTYLLRAEAADAAGNLAATTQRSDGTPMAVRRGDGVVAPAGSGGRGGRRSDGARGEGGARGARGGKNGAARTRLLARLVGARGRPHGPGRLSGRPRGAEGDGKGLSVGFGDPARLVGRLTDAAGDGLAGRTLRVLVRPARGARGGERSLRLRTDAGGRFELALPAGPSRRLSVIFPGGRGLAPSRRRGLWLRVRAAVSLRTADAELRTGEVLRLSGRVGSRGAAIPRPGKLVTISYFERATRSWRPVLVARSDRGGRFEASYRFRYVRGLARIRLRATAPAEARWPYATGSSAPLTVEVRG